jgi:molybdate transport system substrate-binding protein
MTLLVFAAPVAAEEVTAFAAASLTDALKDVAQGFEAKTGHKVVFNLGASNDLARQIRAGALADVFFSADKAQMDGLEAAGLAWAANRRGRAVQRPRGRRTGVLKYEDRPADRPACCQAPCPG